VRAVATLVADRSTATGRTRCTTLRSDPPLTLRATGGDTVHLVGSAAGPVGGDDLHLSLTVGADAGLTVRSVAAAVALPGPSGAPSTLAVHATVASGASLRWRPEPTIAATGCDHRAPVRLDLAADAELLWREVVVLGRHDEPPGSLLQRLRVDVDGRPLLRNDLAVGPRWPGSQGPAGVGDARTVATALVVGPTAERLPLPEGSEVRAAVLPLDGHAALVTVLAPHALAAITALDAVLDAAIPAAAV
jgi:urease accessory protein